MVDLRKTTASKILGDYAAPPDENEAYKWLDIAPSAASLEERWPVCGRSADQLADFVGESLPDDERIDRLDIVDSMGYIANELLENAIKFSYQPAVHGISFAVFLSAEAVWLYASNAVSSVETTMLQEVVHRLKTGDLEQMFQDRVERSLVEDKFHASLGFLTILMDYGATLGWKIEKFGETNWVTTMARLAITHLAIN